MPAAATNKGKEEMSVFVTKEMRKIVVDLTEDGMDVSDAFELLKNVAITLRQRGVGQKKLTDLILGGTESRAKS